MVTNFLKQWSQISHSTQQLKNAIFLLGNFGPTHLLHSINTAFLLPHTSSELLSAALGCTTCRALGCARCLTLRSVRSDMFLHMLVTPSARACLCVAQRLLTLRACTRKRHSMHGVVAYCEWQHTHGCTTPEKVRTQCWCCVISE